MENTYFANLPKDELAEAVIDRAQDYYEEIERNGRLGLWRRVYRYYYSLDEYGFHDAAEIKRGGEEDELSLLRANHYRNLLQQLLALVTQNRPAFECRAVNTDYESQVQTILGRNILEYYLREQRHDNHYYKACETAVVFSEAYIVADWDPDAGDIVSVDPETGEVINTGDVELRVYEPLNTIRRTREQSDTKNKWHIFRDWEDRHDLIAKYPEYAEEISQYSESFDQRFWYYPHGITSSDNSETDMIPIYYFYHDRTPACPNGRQAVVLGPDITLDSRPLQCPRYPVTEIIPSKQSGTSFGYSVSFDLLCVQEAIDILYSTILSNQATFGVQNIWMKPGSGLTPIEIGGGLNILESDEEPKPLNLVNTPPEIFNFLKQLETLEEMLSGVNSVVRGQPEASLKSGAALALVASQAVQFSSGLQAGYTRLLEDTGTTIIKLLQTKASIPRATAIAGKDKRSYVKDFTGDQLKNINRVIVDIGNPVTRTLAGRIQMADTLLERQAIKSPSQYVQIVETGRIEAATEDDMTEEMLMDRENEALRDGKSVNALIVDKHMEHINAHKLVLGGPDERNNPELTARVLAHIQEHINHLRGGDRTLLNILGQQPLGPDAPMNQGKNAPQPNAKPQPGEPPQPGQPTQPGQQVQAPNAAPEVQQNMPRMPVPEGQ